MSESAGSSEIQSSVDSTLQTLRKNTLFLNYPEDTQAEIAESVFVDPKAYILRALRYLNLQYLDENQLIIEAKQYLELLYLIAVKYSNDTELTREVGKCYAAIGYYETKLVQARILLILNP